MNCRAKIETEAIVAITVMSLISPALTIQAADAMNAVSERYVHLVLALGQHDPDYVDAFYGPICRPTSIARSISRRTKVIPAVTFTIRCWKRTWSAIAAGWSFRFTRCSRRNRL